MHKHLFIPYTLYCSHTLHSEDKGLYTLSIDFSLVARIMAFIS